MNFTANHKKKWYRKNEVLADTAEGEDNMSKLEYLYARPHRTKSSKETGQKRYRYLTIEEYKALEKGDRVDVIGAGGEIYNCRVNGVPQVWKTRPRDVKVPLKYGLYECSYGVYMDGMRCETRIVVEVPELTKLVSSEEVAENYEICSEGWQNLVRCCLEHRTQEL